MDVRKNQIKRGVDYINVDSLVSFVNALYNKNKQLPLNFVFYGGEPLLYQDSIVEFINKTQDLKLNYSLHTNGVLLNNIDSYILKSINTIILSIDGNEATTNRNRGKNIYSKIRNNVDYIRNVFDGEIIARSTLSLDDSVYDSVHDLITWLDGIYWQIENSPLVDQRKMALFIERYYEDISNLVEFWVKNMSKGKLVNILPFQAIASSFIFKNKEESLRCGCGSQLVITDGVKCYACDELAEHAKEVFLGTINDDIETQSSIISSKINEICNNCTIRYICGGRCYHSLAYFPIKKLKFYCKATHILVNSISKQMSQVENLINNGSINSSQISNSHLKLVDQIP